MPSVGSSRIRSLGSHDERARDRELLLLAAREITATPVQHFLQHREHLEHVTGNRPAALFRREAHQQILFDRQAREDLAALGHVADAERRPVVGWQRGDVHAVEADAAGGDRQQSHQAPQQRGLADAIPAEQRGAGARSDLDAHVAQDVAAAVILVHAFDLQHGATGLTFPGRPRSRAGRFAPPPACLRPARCLRTARSPCARCERRNPCRARPRSPNGRPPG